MKLKIDSLRFHFLLPLVLTNPLCGVEKNTKKKNRRENVLFIHFLFVLISSETLAFFFALEKREKMRKRGQEKKSTLLLRKYV